MGVQRFGRGEGAGAPHGHVYRDPAHTLSGTSPSLARGASRSCRPGVRPQWASTGSNQGGRGGRAANRARRGRGRPPRPCVSRSSTHAFWDVTFEREGGCRPGGRPQGARTGSNEGGRGGSDTCRSKKIIFIQKRSLDSSSSRASSFSPLKNALTTTTWRPATTATTTPSPTTSAAFPPKRRRRSTARYALASAKPVVPWPCSRSRVRDSLDSAEA